MTKRHKILYVASTASHLRRFHAPYLAELKKNFDVYTMATGENVDFPILFDKHFFSFANLRSIFKIRKILKQEHFDAVLLHTTLAAFLVRAAMLLSRKRPYVLNVVHGYLFSKDQKGIKDRVLLLCEKLLRNKTDDIAVMNAEDLEIAQKHRLCRGRVDFINGMGVDGFWELPHPDPALRASFAATEQELLCTFVGELSGRKNQIFLIRALKALRDSGIPARLLLVGEGGERETLEAEIAALSLQNAVFLTGNREPVTPYLAISDLYVSASRSEGLPFNVMEAMLCGLPIVASATKGQTDLLTDMPNSLYPLDDTDAFCRLVKAVYVQKNYGVGSRSYPVLSRYRLSSVFEKNIDVLTRGFLQRRKNE